MLECRIDQKDAVDRVKLSPDMSALFIFDGVTLFVYELPEVTQGQIKGGAEPFHMKRIPSRHSSPFLWLLGAHKHTQSFSSRQPAISLCGNCGDVTGKTNACSCVSSKPVPTVARSAVP